MANSTGTMEKPESQGDEKLLMNVSSEETDDAILDLIHHSTIYGVAAKDKTQGSNTTTSEQTINTETSASISTPLNQSPKQNKTTSDLFLKDNYSNHFPPSPKLKMNPKDALSPRKSRAVQKRKEYGYDYDYSTTPQDINNMNTNASIGNAENMSLTSNNTNTPARSIQTKTSFQSHHDQQSYSSQPQNNYHSYAQNAASVASRSVTNQSIKSLPYRQSKKSPLQSAKAHRKLPSLQLGEEQILFEQRLCHSENGVAVRKIHSNGKSQLRYVKCILYDESRGRKSLKGSRSMAGSVGGRKYGTPSHNMSMSVPGVPQHNYSSSKSVASLMGRISLGARGKSKSRRGLIDTNEDDNSKAMTEQMHEKQSLALTWGNKKKVVIPLSNFIEVRKGKTTSRTIRNPCPSDRLLSLITSEKKSGSASLDIEAPTELDRDKFAKAFSVFLGVPLKDDFIGEHIDISPANSPDRLSRARGRKGNENSGDDDDVFSLPSTSTASSMMTPHGMVEYQIGGGSLLPSLPSSPDSRTSSKLMMEEHNISVEHTVEEEFSLDGADSLKDLLPPPVKREGLESTVTSTEMEKSLEKEADEKVEEDIIRPIPDAKKSVKPKKEKEATKNKDEDDDEISAVSSLTHGYDQEIVEELHQALNDLRAELDTSRAEAARAVKVAEQAIQSAESCSSNDWNSTVTHKAAEAAAQAQKRSAEAIAKQKAAEEKLTAERKSSTFWRQQAMGAESKSASLETRLAVAQVQRTAVSEELRREKQKAVTYIKTMKKDYELKESIQRETLGSAAAQNRLLEIELDGTRRDLIVKSQEVKALQDAYTELKSDVAVGSKSGNKKKFFGKGKKSREPLLLETRINVDSDENENPVRTMQMQPHSSEELLKIQAETVSLKKQFEVLRRTASDELKQLPLEAKEWASKASSAVAKAQEEVQALKHQLAIEVTSRRKLLHEVQDLRGTVRVYCRPRPQNNGDNFLNTPSHEICLINKDHLDEAVAKDIGPMCFQFDKVFYSNTSQSEVYSEMEELVLGSLEGFNACLICYGESGSGKSHTMIGDMEVSQGDGFGDDSVPLVKFQDHGIHFRALNQLFQVSNRRRNIFEDSFTLSILEIHDEKLVDLVEGTSFAERVGIIRGGDTRKASSRNESNNSESSRKLEIMTNHEGDTVVDGQILVPIHSMEEAIRLWEQCMSLRHKRLVDSGSDIGRYNRSSHIVATLEITSTNNSTGVGSVGKIQFADLASSDVVQRRGSASRPADIDNILAPVGNRFDWKFKNKSISTLADVVDARVNFSRNPPYRHSSLTHVLRDALEADTKTVLLSCVKTDRQNVQNTANTLRFASKIKKVVIGKATKRHISIA